jgi:hypothetical protein
VNDRPDRQAGGNGGWDPFAGTLDEVAVCASALPAGWVSAHFAAGAGYHAAVLADSPAAYYRLDDGSLGPAVAPATVADASGQSHGASWSGGVVFGGPGLAGGLGGASVGVGGGNTYVQVPSAAFGAYPTSGSTTSYSLTFDLCSTTKQLQAQFCSARFGQGGHRQPRSGTI